MKVSFVIPVKNEEKYLGLCLKSIKDACQGLFDYEIVLVDNGSADRTVAIAKENGVTVILEISGAIGHCRNEGVRSSTGDVLIFLDGDVELTPAWRNDIVAEISVLMQKPGRYISGSWYRTTMTTPLERHWFELLSEGVKTHMNGGHLIIERAGFDRVGGFSELLTTGEDYEFCERAVASGFDIRNATSLVVIHHGYPKTWRGFFWREVWHGRGDYQSLQKFLGSKTALACTAIAASSIGCLALAVLFRQPELLVVLGAIWLGGSAGLVFRTFGHLDPRHVLCQLFTAMVYVTARALSAVPGASAFAAAARLK